MTPRHPPPPAGPGPLLRGARTAAGLTQRELAVSSGVSTRSVSELESGRNRGPQRSTVEALADALGASPRLRAELHRAATAGRGGRGRSGPPPASPAPGTVSPAFPAPPADFTGRGPELAALRPLAAAAAGGTGTTAGIALVTGQPGLGKTALALRLAQECADHFPDGRFHLSLGGSGTRPLRSGAALARLLRALGVPAARIPSDTEERGDLYRSVTHGRGMLLLLDDAADEEQVRPLLPGGPRCLVLVTGRRALAGLESSVRLRPGVLSTAEAVRLLDRVAGGGTVAAEPGAAEELARLCGRLPPALRAAGNRLAVLASRAGPAAPVRQLVGLLRPEGPRLGRLGYGGRLLRASFASSYRQLTPGTRRLFRLLALVPGPDFGPELAASLATLPPPAAGAALEELADAGLLEPAAAAFRYRFPELLRLFAAGELRAADGPAVRAAAESRMADALLHRAAAALRAAGGTAGAGAGTTDFPGGRAEALGWLDAELPNWTAAVRRAAGLDARCGAADVAEAMHRVFASLGHDPWRREIPAPGARTDRAGQRTRPDRSSSATSAACAVPGRTGRTAE
ncbi:helix-turn-helix domain-containing protein [Streptomyces sp. TRM 70361]|uniref:helix-turn-helix domain-containing protein n=1 Tax=Streptomyces sp. TRM 70361 TaxID=3116553 RepID=UPI002E7C304F|nr:helix-turn-helix domain-containing protein [Streptomyces sp. TRM 70361]MEE1940300.1 helix-turn-helix domain-containing protein [Streptomyces sp. TRM 70361]